ncbi:hypothetical protein ACFV08_21805, partial [Streptomyces fradiae]
MSSEDRTSETPGAPGTPQSPETARTHERQGTASGPHVPRPLQRERDGEDRAEATADAPKRVRGQAPPGADPQAPPPPHPAG